MATARVCTNSALWLKPSAGMTATEHKEAGCGGEGGLVGNRRWSNKWSPLHSHCLTPISMEVSGLYSVTGHSKRQKGTKLELRQLTRGTATREAGQIQYSASAWVWQTTHLSLFNNCISKLLKHNRYQNYTPTNEKSVAHINTIWFFLSMKLRNIYKLGILISATINSDRIWHAKCDEQTMYRPLKWE